MRSRLAAQRGFSLVELSVAILIALFLIGGVIVVEQGVHTSYGDQSGLSKLQDEERFAMSLLTEEIQSAGYFPDPHDNSIDTAFPASGNFQALWSVYGPASAASAPHDSIYVRFMTASGDGIDLCDGSTNTTGANVTYASYFYLAADSDGTDYDLDCELQPGTGAAFGTAVPLVSGLQDMQILYGVNPSGGTAAEEYMYASDVTTGGYWPDVDSVKVMLTFTNPLAKEVGQPPDVTFTKVIPIMSRVGVTE
jgi:type IV pilus assembly protein PilW